MKRALGRALFGLLFATALTAPASAQEVLPLWPGSAPGSESWSFVEHAAPKSDGGLHISDVTKPTLTVFLPDRSKANGTAVLIAPGGGMVGLEMPAYDNGPAQWFNDRGVAVFLLKYRVLPTAWQVRRTPPTITVFSHANANPFPRDKCMTATIKMAIADARQALTIIRGNARLWGIDPEKVGMLGYSAGGGVAIGAAVAPTLQGGKATPSERPSFIISAYGPSLVDVIVPENPPPLFLAVKQNHPNVAPALIAAFQEWTAAHAPAELHVYDQFGGSPFLDSTGEWLDRAYDWMQARGYGFREPDPDSGKNP